MIGGALIGGVVGALLSAGGAVLAGQSLLAALAWYVAGGSISLLLLLVLGSRGRHSGPPRRPGRPSAMALHAVPG